MKRGTVMKKYTNVISLGYFCSVALEIKRLNMRNGSYPFDWILTDSMKNVIDLIENSFENFLEFEHLAQYRSDHGLYKNMLTGISFYHDFSEFKSARLQYEAVKDKYDRRIKRFYTVIEQPTLFIRYISSQEDMDYVISNYNYIEEVLKRFHNNNHIIYVANNNLQSDLSSNQAEIYYVAKDDNDSVARKFLDKNADLKEYIISNCEECMQLKSKSSKKHTLGKAINKFRRTFKWYYTHDKVCEN